MKLLATALLIASSFAVAQTGSVPSQGSFSFNQGSIALHLEQKEFETIFRTDQVPDTCYRDEVQGTRTECHTEIDRLCATRYEDVCRILEVPVCQTVMQRECRNEQQCHTELDRICNARGCTNVPRNVCVPVQRCYDQPTRVCHNETRRECHSEPRQDCRDVPHQACRAVPNVVRVAYSCTRPVQVPIGQRLSMHTTAQVYVNLVNFSEVGQLPDSLVATLANGDVRLSARSPNNAYLYQVLSNQRSEQVISETEKVLSIRIDVSAISIQKLNGFASSEIVNSKLFYDHLEFAIRNVANPNMNLPLKGHLALVQLRNGNGGKSMIDDDFGFKDLIGPDLTRSLNFNVFGVDSLKDKTHSVELSLSLDFEGLKRSLINPESLALVANPSIVASFEAFPAQ